MDRLHNLPQGHPGVTDGGETTKIERYRLQFGASSAMTPKPQEAIHA
jgi:hypothetical protein